MLFGGSVFLTEKKFQNQLLSPDTTHFIHMQNKSNPFLASLRLPLTLGERGNKSPGNLIKMQNLGLCNLRFWLSKYGVGPQNLLFE